MVIVLIPQYSNVRIKVNQITNATMEGHVRPNWRSARRHSEREATIESQQWNSLLVSARVSKLTTVIVGHASPRAYLTAKGKQCPAS